jgi:hypothetical protein
MAFYSDASGPADPSALIRGRDSGNYSCFDPLLIPIPTLQLRIACVISALVMANAFVTLLFFFCLNLSVELGRVYPFHMTISYDRQLGCNTLYIIFACTIHVGQVMTTNRSDRSRSRDHDIYIYCHCTHHSPLFCATFLSQNSCEE